MPVLASRLDTTAEAFVRNRQGMLAKLRELDELFERVRAGGGEKYVTRHHARGKLLPRERVELLLDRDAPFLELSPLAAHGTEYVVGASVVTGIGVVSGVECVVVAHDPPVRGGATNPFSLKKALRAMDIARENRLPLVNLVESGGADLPRRSRSSDPAGCDTAHSRSAWRPAVAGS